MQPASRQQFLRNVGFGALSVPIRGKQALVLLQGPPVFPPLPKPPLCYGSVEQQAAALLKGYNIPGIAIGLIRGGKLAYARGFGFQDVETHKPMTEYALTTIASLTKTFTAAAVMQLQEAGRLSLDDPFVKHVPYFHMADPRYQDITIRHILAHTSGLPESEPDHFYNVWKQPCNDDDCASRLVRSLDDGRLLSQAPGRSDAEFRYSDLGYSILAALVQEVTGESFEDYQRKHILEPLMMHKSTFLVDRVNPWELMTPHTRDTSGNPAVYHGPFLYNRQWGPSGCLATNIVELSHFVIALMKGGKYINRIMAPETVAQLWTPLYQEPWSWPGAGYSSGFFILQYAGIGSTPVRMIVSCGGRLGFCGHLSMFPDQGIASLVFVNLKAAYNEPAYEWGFCDSLAIQMLRGELR